MDAKEIGRITSTPDPDTFEKYRDTPLISIAILLQSYALLLAESSTFAAKFYHDTPPICIAMFLQKYWRQGSLEHSQRKSILDHFFSGRVGLAILKSWRVAAGCDFNLRPKAKTFVPAQESLVISVRVRVAGALKTLTSLNKESGPFFCLLVPAIIVFGSPEGRFENC